MLRRTTDVFFLIRITLFFGPKLARVSPLLLDEKAAIRHKGRQMNCHPTAP
jgi:hypothetical protein